MQVPARLYKSLCYPVWKYVTLKFLNVLSQWSIESVKGETCEIEQTKDVARVTYHRYAAEPKEKLLTVHAECTMKAWKMLYPVVL